MQLLMEQKSTSFMGSPREPPSLFQKIRGWLPLPRLVCNASMRSRMTEALQTNSGGGSQASMGLNGGNSGGEEGAGGRGGGRAGGGSACKRAISSSPSHSKTGATGGGGGGSGWGASGNAGSTHHKRGLEGLDGGRGLGWSGNGTSGSSNEIGLGGAGESSNVGTIEGEFRA